MLSTSINLRIIFFEEDQKNIPFAAKNITVRKSILIICAKRASFPMLLLLIRIILSSSSNFFTSRLRGCTCVIIEKIRKKGRMVSKKSSCYR